MYKLDLTKHPWDVWDTSVDFGLRVGYVERLGYGKYVAWFTLQDWPQSYMSKWELSHRHTQLGTFTSRDDAQRAIEEMAQARR